MAFRVLLYIAAYALRASDSFTAYVAFEIKLHCFYPTINIHVICFLFNIFSVFVNYFCNNKGEKLTNCCNGNVVGETIQLNPLRHEKQRQKKLKHVKAI